MWRGGAYFPCCPHDFGTDRLDDYFEKLIVGAVLAYSDHGDVYYKLTVLECVILSKKSSILVMCSEADSKWEIVGIELHEKSKHFIHFILGSYSSKGEAEEAFNEKRTANFWSEGYGGAYNL